MSKSLDGKISLVFAEAARLHRHYQRHRHNDVTVRSSCNGQRYPLYTLRIPESQIQLILNYMFLDNFFFT